MQQSKQTRALIYTRFSPRPTHQMDNCVSPQTQEQACREYAKSKGYRVEGVFGDEGVSRETLDREGLAKCLDEVRRGTVVLIYHPDRLGSEIPAMVATHTITSKGGSVEYPQDALNGNDPMVKAMRSFHHIIAGLNNAMNSIKTSDAMQQRSRNGELMTHPDRAPYGLKQDPDNPKRTIRCPEEQQVIQMILDLRSKGMSINKIAGRLNTDGVKPRNGKQFYASTVSNIVKRAEDPINEQSEE